MFIKYNAVLELIENARNKETKTFLGRWNKQYKTNVLFKVFNKFYAFPYQVSKALFLKMG